jgi:hypothetical protein
MQCEWKWLKINYALYVLGCCKIIYLDSNPWCAYGSCGALNFEDLHGCGNGNPAWSVGWVIVRWHIYQLLWNGWPKSKTPKIRLQLLTSNSKALLQLSKNITSACDLLNTITSSWVSKSIQSSVFRKKLHNYWKVILRPGKACIHVPQRPWRWLDMHETAIRYGTRKGPFTERHPELEAFLVTSNIQCLQSELQWNSMLRRCLHNPHTYLATTIKISASKVTGDCNWRKRAYLLILCHWRILGSKHGDQPFWYWEKHNDTNLALTFVMSVFTKKIRLMT